MTLASPIAFAGAPLDLAENDRNDAQLAAYSKAGNARAILVHDGRILVSGTGELAYVHPQALAGKHLPDPGPLFLGRDQGVPVFAFSIAREEEGTGLGEDFKFEILRALALICPRIRLPSPDGQNPCLTGTGNTGSVPIAARKAGRKTAV